MTERRIRYNLDRKSEFLHPFDIKEKYSSLKDRLAYYLLLQVHTFMKTSGLKGLPKAMEQLVEKAANINAHEARQHPQEKRPEFLGSELAKHMGETFSSDYHVEKEKDNFKVVLDRCGCIESVIEHSKEFSFSESESKAIFCGSCMGGYRGASEKLGLKFDGSLSRKGCYMHFKIS